MRDPVDERLADLERLVLRQAERIAALEERLDVAQQIAATRIVREFRARTDEAA